MRQSGKGWLASTCPHPPPTSLKVKWSDESVSERVHKPEMRRFLWREREYTALFKSGERIAALKGINNYMPAVYKVWCWVVGTVVNNLSVVLVPWSFCTLAISLSNPFHLGSGERVILFWDPFQNCPQNSCCFSSLTDFEGHRMTALQCTWFYSQHYRMRSIWLPW